MHKTTRVICLGLPAILLCGTANAQNNTNMQVSQSECQQLWKQLNPSNAATINSAQSQSLVSDFKKVDTDNDGTIDLNEFNKGCNSGLVKNSSSSGTSSGASGTR
jgi:Ca2+-binding EF-hand superfamily protein